MPQGTTNDVAVVEAFVGALGEGRVNDALACVSDDLVFSEAPSLSFGGDWSGRQGLLDMLAVVSRDFRIRLEPAVVTQAGDRVLVRVSGTIASRETKRSMALQALDLYEVVEGKIARVDVFYKDAAAVTELSKESAHA